MNKKIDPLLNDNIAISVKNLTKVYHLYDNPKDRLKEALNPFGKKYHHDFYALKDVSFEIQKGETVGIIGKNGAGKSTLLKIITGVLTPTSGEVQVNGKIASLLELGAGFNPEMTGLENIYLNGTIMGFTKEEMYEKVDAILSFADIGEFIHQPVKMYSSGMFARLAFSVAINVEPDVLIVDEALSVGDMAFQNKCFQKMDSFIDNYRALLFVSHGLSAVRLLCDKVIWIDNGKMVSYGDTEIVTQQYEEFMQTGLFPNKENKLVNIDYFKNESDFRRNRYRYQGEIIPDPECYISDIMILKNDIYTNKFYTFDRMVIKILIQNEINDNINIGLGIAIYSSNGIEITRLNNIRDDKSLYIEKGDNIIEIVFEKILLLDGEYYLSFFLSKDNLTESYHKLENIVEINVTTQYAQCGWKKYEGIVALPHEWILK